MSLPIEVAQRNAISLKLGLDVAGLLFMPILVLVPHGIAPLASIAGALAIGPVLINGGGRPSELLSCRQRCPGALLVWATISCEVAHIGTGSADLPYLDAPVEFYDDPLGNRRRPRC